MDKDEARQVARERIAELRVMPYEELRELEQTDVRRGPSGATYQVQVESFPDGGSRGDLRVTVAVDDGHWSAFRPLVEDFIIARDGSFVDEGHGR